MLIKADGSVRHLMKMGRADEEQDHMQFSPDGRYIAYDHQNESTSGDITFPTEKDIYLLSADGKIQIPLVRNPANDRLLGWTPDGRNILFTSDRTGAVDVWMLPVKDGRPSGEARIVSKGIGAGSPLGFTRDGSFFYGGGKDMWNIYIATLESKSVSKTATYIKLGLPLEGRNGTAEISPDGNRLTFIRSSNRSGTGPGAIAESVLCIHGLETGEEKTFPLNLQPSSLRWAPDGSSILIGASHDMKSFVATIDAMTGEIKPVFQIDKDIREELYISPDWSPDGHTVYCVKCGGGQCAIIAKDLETGQIRTVYEETSRLPLISVSPDGKWLAAYEASITEARKAGATERILKIISTEHGNARELSRFVNATNHTLFPRWSIDGRYIFFPGIRPGEETWDVWYVPVEGGKPNGLGLALHRIQDISFHPDGVRFSFSSFGPATNGPEVWVMENFLPEQE
jgi:Tol biopolymer transport system component